MAVQTEGAISNSLDKATPEAKKSGKVENHSINMTEPKPIRFQSCSQCGKIHPREECPTKEAIC